MGWGASHARASGLPHPLPSSSPQIPPPKRFALRDGSKPVKGEVLHPAWGKFVSYTGPAPPLGVWCIAGGPPPSFPHLKGEGGDGALIPANVDCTASDPIGLEGDDPGWRACSDPQPAGGGISAQPRAASTASLAGMESTS